MTLYSPIGRRMKSTRLDCPLPSAYKGNVAGFQCGDWKFLGSARDTGMTRFVHTTLLAAVLLSPLPFGSIHPMAYTTLAIVVAVLVGLWTLGAALSREAPPVTLGRIGVPALLFAIAVSWAAIQSAPWTPVSWHNPVWAEAAAALGRPLAGAVSIDPFATRTSVMRLLCYAGIFWLALQLGRSAKTTSRTFTAIAVAGLVYAACLAPILSAICY